MKSPIYSGSTSTIRKNTHRIITVCQEKVRIKTDASRSGVSTNDSETDVRATLVPDIYARTAKRFQRQNLSHKAPGLISYFGLKPLASLVNFAYHFARASRHGNPVIAGIIWIGFFLGRLARFRRCVSICERGAAAAP